MAVNPAVAEMKFHPRGLRRADAYISFATIGQLPQWPLLTISRQVAIRAWVALKQFDLEIY